MISFLISFLTLKSHLFYYIKPGGYRHEKKINTATLTISTLLLPVTSFCTTHSIAKTAGQPKLSAKKLIMKTGQTKKLKLKNVSGKNQKKIKWSSNNKSIITVNKSGLIKAKKKGKGKIMAKYNNKTYTCNVTVKKRPATKPERQPSN